jgi:hypothetical protein
LRARLETGPERAVAEELRVEIRRVGDLLVEPAVEERPQLDGRADAEQPDDDDDQGDDAGDQPARQALRTNCQDRGALIT